MQKINLICEDSYWRAQLLQQCTALNIQHSELSDFTLLAKDGFLSLLFNVNRLSLQQNNYKRVNPIMVDFTQGSKYHRLKYGGGMGQTIAKAVGLKSGYRPNVLDATAGLAGDAFVLAGLGCVVQLIERHPVVRLLLQNGLERGYLNGEIGEWLKERLQLIAPLSLDAFLSENKDVPNLNIDVVYLDPMYPHRKKSALVKKEMFCFQQLVGTDSDADQLLSQAMKLALKRVVVKRPDYADFLADVKPTLSYLMKNNRFDVYVKSASDSLGCGNKI